MREAFIGAGRVPLGRVRREGMVRWQDAVNEAMLLDIVMEGDGHSRRCNGELAIAMRTGEEKIARRSR